MNSSYKLPTNAITINEYCLLQNKMAHKKVSYPAIVKRIQRGKEVEGYDVLKLGYKELYLIPKNDIVVEANDSVETELPSQEEQLASTNEWKLLEAHNRLEILQTWAGTSSTRVFLLEWKAGYHKHLQFIKIGDRKKEIKISERTLQDWRKMYEERDFKGLLPKYAEKKRGKVTPVIAKKLTDLYLNQNKPSKAVVIRDTRKWAKTQDLISLPSDRTLERYLDWYISRHNDEVTYIREGKKRFLEKNVFTIRRDWRKVKFGDVVVGDGYTCNFLIQTPDGKNERMTLVLFMDAKSFYPLGWAFASTESSYSVSFALKNAIQKLGFLPRILLLDNGRGNKTLGDNSEKKYLVKKAWKADYDLELRGESLLSWGVKLRFAKAYNGRSKPVERFFGMLNEFDQSFASYVGNNIANKPAGMHRGDDISQDFRAKLLSAPGGIPTIEEANKALEQWVEEFVNRPRHKSKLFKGLSPKQIMEADLPAIYEDDKFFKRDITNINLMDLVYSSERRSTIIQNGINFMGADYWNDEFLKYDRGQNKVNFIIKYDQMDLSQIWIYEGSRFLFTAQRQELQHPFARDLGDYEDFGKFIRSVNQQKNLAKAGDRAVKERQNPTKARKKVSKNITAKRMQLPKEKLNADNSDYFIQLNQLLD